LYFDWAFKYLSIEDRVDRFDVLGPSSDVGNTLASRVKSIHDQIIGDAVEVYQKILWNTSDLGAALVKEEDWTLLDVFLNQHTNHPGVYLAGDNLAEVWNAQTGAGALNVRATWMSFNLVHGDHKTLGIPVSPLVTSSAGSPIGPAAMIAYGGCPAPNGFDVLQPTGGAIPIMDYPVSAQSAVIGQATPNASGTTARVVLSGFAYNFIRDDTVGETLDRVTHLRDILTWFENIIPEPVGIDPLVFANQLEYNYPNPFNPATTIRYSIAERGHVTLKIYNAGGQLVRTLVDEVQSPRRDGFRVTWDGLNHQGQPVASGVYFYKLSAKAFVRTKKMVMLK
ncbi:MAG: T9SS type A sorting domain-containing protein, partial [Candidatus Latescibacterota bacterium]